MKKTSILLTAAFLTAASASAQVMKPEAGKYYRIKHVSGLYLTDKAFNGKVAEKVEDNSQIVQFIPVAGAEDTYNIMRVRRSQFYGSDKNWSSTIISRDIPYSRFKIEKTDLKEGYVVFKNIGLSQLKGKSMYLGTDNYNSDANVYTDKSGTDATKHIWTIEEANKYDETASELPDLYPNDNIPASDPRANAYPGYKLVFAEEFGGSGKPDSQIWTYETGFCRNQEHQYYDGNKNCYLQDGVLVIEAKDILAEKRKNPKYTAGNNSWPSNIGQYIHWTSGSMQTKGGWNSGYTWKYGIYEVRAKIPQMNGCWPAIWSTGKQYEWPYGGEIDIMEYYGNAIHGNVCWGNGGRWSAKWNSAIVRDSELGAGWGDEYHIWRMIWDYDHMELWCDDFLVNNINLDETVNVKPSESFDHGNGCNPFRDVRHMLWLNLAIGGQNGGDPYSPPYPNRYLIDYARVYQKIGTDGKATYHVDPQISEPTFSLKDGQENTGLSGVEAPVVEELSEERTEYFSLQGFPVADPQPGQIVIRRCGNDVSKTVIR